MPDSGRLTHGGFLFVLRGGEVAIWKASEELIGRISSSGIWEAREWVDGRRRAREGGKYAFCSKLCGIGKRCLNGEIVSAE